MHTKVLTPSCWSTASLAEHTDAMPAERRALGAHLQCCQGCSGRWFALRCLTDQMTGFASSRFISTLVVLALVLGVASLTL
jgi:hypothetical protein